MTDELPTNTESYSGADLAAAANADELIAVDIGNARIKVGRFERRRIHAPNQGGTEPTAALPEPDATLPLDGRRPAFDRLAQWLDSPELVSADGLGRPAGSKASPASRQRTRAWWVASVNRPTTARLLDWLHEQRPRDRVVLLSSADLPLKVQGPRADMVGVDRLIDAVAANALRTPGRPAVVVDVGTAITVDYLDDEGAFRGGAILPGIAMSARALHEFTDLLPLIEMSELSSPPKPVGSTTEDAMRAGLFWLAVGAIRELTRRGAIDGPSEASPDDQTRGAAQTEIFLSGGAGAAVADLLGQQARHVPHLTLGGIALTARTAPHLEQAARGERAI